MCYNGGGCGFHIWSASNWVSLDKNFEEVPIHELKRSCEVFFQKCCTVNSVRTSWLLPLQEVLKLNFYGSFFEECKGGYGGVIRNSCGQILCGLSGPIECVDANGAEVFAMLLGYRELHKLEATNAIVEVDSFSAIQWGSGKSKCPWRFEDWVEEVHFLSA